MTLTFLLCLAERRLCAQSTHSRNGIEAVFRTPEAAPHVRPLKPEIGRLASGTERGPSFGPLDPEAFGHSAEPAHPSGPVADREGEPVEAPEYFNWDNGNWANDEPPEENDEDVNGESPSVHVTGQVQIDFLTYNQSERNKQALGNLENATGFRRARLGAFGEIFETTEYRIEWDFAGQGRPRFLDNWIAVQDLGLPVMGNVIVGHFFEPFSLERYTPNRFITFVERSSVDEFAPARNTGLMLFDHTDDERVTWAAGAFRSDSDVFGDSVNDSADWAGTGHITWLAWYDEASDGRYLLHLGASYSYRAMGDKVVQFRKQPENQLQAFEKRDFPTFVDTGPIPAEAHQLFGLEAALVHGSFSMQSEVAYTAVDRIDGANPGFYAWYVYGSYFLTGEHRSYSPTTILGRFREGIFQRITPHTNAFKGDVEAGKPRGPGAWEVALRWSYIDLDSRGIRGGRLGTVTVGLNWYLNPHTRIQWNYLRPFLHEAETGMSTADIVTMRFGFEF